MTKETNMNHKELVKRCLNRKEASFYASLHRRLKSGRVIGTAAQNFIRQVAKWGGDDPEKICRDAFDALFVGKREVGTVLVTTIKETKEITVYVIPKTPNQLGPAISYIQYNTIILDEATWNLKGTKIFDFALYHEIGHCTLIDTVDNHAMMEVLCDSMASMLTGISVEDLNLTFSKLFLDYIPNNQKKATKKLLDDQFLVRGKLSKETILLSEMYAKELAFVIHPIQWIEGE
jgi:hypothetical protein